MYFSFLKIVFFNLCSHVYYWFVMLLWINHMVSMILVLWNLLKFSSDFMQALGG